MTKAQSKSNLPALPGLSVVVPVRNEAENIRPLLTEILAAVEGRFDSEILYVDDGSSDATLATLQECRAEEPRLKVLAHRVSCGQSAAIHTAVRHATKEWIAVLDGDGQNDPADFAVLWDWIVKQDTTRCLAIGRRVDRQDSDTRRFASRLANTVRARLLGDAVPDSGCGLKILSRNLFLELPYFDHMHRFMPALVLRAGGKVASIPVRHRPRTAGVSKYGNLDRALVGVTDLFGVWWLGRRCKPRDVIVD
jgi:dolichol-phosphate mannosyltransferase